MSSPYKVMCGCDCCISAQNIHSCLLTWRYRHMIQLKDQIHNSQNKRCGEIESRIIETYKNVLRPHVCNIHKKNHHTQPWKQCVPVLLYIMILLTRSMCYIVVINVQVFSYPFKRKIHVQQAHVQQYIFMSTEMYHVVHCMVDIHMKNRNIVKCVT